VVTETHGRERRHRYYTYRGYRSLLARENLEDDGPHSSADLSRAGGFFQLPTSEFWNTEEQLFKYQDNFRDQDPRMKNKKSLYKNPIMPDGSVKKGRPRKDGSTQTGRGKKRKKAEEKNEASGEDDLPEPPAKRRKNKDSDPVMDPVLIEEGEGSVTPKRRGRPPKATAKVAEPESTPKKRGRPLKIRQDPPSPAAEESKETVVEVVDMPETADVAQLDPAASSHQLQPAEADRSSIAAGNSMEVSHAASPTAVPLDATDKEALDAEPAASTPGPNQDTNQEKNLPPSVVSPRLEPSHELGGGDESIVSHS
jgi:hypothetical protein